MWMCDIWKLELYGRTLSDLQLWWVCGEKESGLDLCALIFHISLPYFYIYDAKMRLPEPIIHVPWRNVHNESVTQPQASVEH